MNYDKKYFENIIANYIVRIKESNNRFISIIESDINKIKKIKFGLKTIKDKVIKENEININILQKKRDNYINVVNNNSEDFIYYFSLIDIPEPNLNLPCYKQKAIDEYFITVITIITNCDIFMNKNTQDKYSRAVKGHENNNGKRTSGKKATTIKTITNHFESLINYFELIDNLYLAELLHEEKEYAVNMDFSNNNDILVRCYICLVKATYELLIENKYSNDVENYLTHYHGNTALDKIIYKKAKEISTVLLSSFFKKLSKIPTITSFKDTDCIFNYLSKFYNI